MKSQRWLSMNFFTFFFTWGVFLPYWTGYLVNAKHLTVAQAGLIMGIATIVRACSTLFLYPQLSKLYSLSKVMRGFGIAAFIIVLFYIPLDTYTLMFVLTVVFSAVYPNILPGMESGASMLVQADGVHYGKARAYGSFGYTIALVVVGIVLQFMGMTALIYVMAAGLLLIILTQFYQVPPMLLQKPEKVEKAGEAARFKDLIKEKGFVAVLVVSILLQGAHATYYNYGYVYLDDLGVNDFYIGIILNVAVIIEIVFFTQADRLFGSMSVSKMYMIASLGSTLRWVFIVLFPNVPMFIASQMLHAVSFGVAHFAFMQYIARKLKPSFIPLAQGLYAALGMSLSVALLTLLGGYLYTISPGFAFAGMLVCSVPAFLITVLTKKKYSY